MTEATWGSSADPTAIEWTMSAALENVPRGDSELAEVTSLEGAVRAWRDLDAEHRIDARLSTERPIQLDGVPTAIFTGNAIEELAKRLPDCSTGD
jgi:hypothetical protein